MCRSPVKVGTVTKTLTAHAARCGVTESKEATQVLWPGRKWGPTKKGGKNYLAERLHIEPGRLYVGRMEPDGVETLAGQVSDANGPRNVLSRYEYVDTTEVHFEITTLKGSFEDKDIASMLIYLQQNGLGAARSLGYGKCVVTEFTKLSTVTPPSILQLQQAAMASGQPLEQLMHTYAMSTLYPQETRPEFVHPSVTQRATSPSNAAVLIEAHIQKGSKTPAGV